MIKLDAGKGLGDAIYLRAIVLHLLKGREPLTVFTTWPDVFLDLPITIRPLSEAEAQKESTRHASTSGHVRCDEGMDEFKMRCLSAGIREPVELTMRWKVRNSALTKRIKRAAGDRKIFIYQPLKATHNHEQELLRPRREDFIKLIEAHSDYFRVKLGHPPFVPEDSKAPCELDMFGRGFIYDTFDVCTLGDLFFGEPCFIPHAGEAMDRKFIVMFSQRALDSENWVRNITPERLFHKKHLATAVYDKSC